MDNININLRTKGTPENTNTMLPKSHFFNNSEEDGIFPRKPGLDKKMGGGK